MTSAAIIAERVKFIRAVTGFEVEVAPYAGGAMLIASRFTIAHGRIVLFERIFEDELG